MTDHQAIEALIYTYAERLDRGDFAAVADLFRAATYGGRGRPLRRGVAEVTAVLEQTVRLHDDGTPRTMHVTTNVRITIDPAATTATADACFTVLQQTATLPLQIIVGGRYRDTFLRVDGQWQFTSRLIDTDLIGDLREHLRSGALPPTGA